MVCIGTKNYVKSTATLASGESIISVSACAREAENQKGMNDSQLTGSTSSYARKYALNGLFSIDDTKDSDATNDHGKSTQTAQKTTTTSQRHAPAPKPSGKATANQIKYIINLLKSKKLTEKEILEKMNLDVPDIESMGFDNAGNTIKFLQSYSPEEEDIFI